MTFINLNFLRIPTDVLSNTTIKRSIAHYGQVASFVKCTVISWQPFRQSFYNNIISKQSLYRICEIFYNIILLLRFRTLYQIPRVWFAVKYLRIIIT